MRASVQKRALYLLLCTFIAYGVLVASHEGEFWPFSIYPMFSQAGNEWSRAVVRSVDESGTTTDWASIHQHELPGEPLALTDYGLRHDLANFIARTETWDDDRVAGLERMFREPLRDHRLLVYRVRGGLVDGDSVAVWFEPYAFLSADTTVLNPDLR